VLAVAHDQLLLRTPAELMGKIVRRGCLIDVKTVLDAELFRREGLRVWRL
jgi:hypothetical protein